MNENFSHQEPWEALILEILHRRDDPEYRTTRAAIRQGFTPFTQVRAFPYVLPSLPENAHSTQRDALLRTAALAAEYERIPHSSRGKRLDSLGRWAFRVAASADKYGRSQSIDPINPGMIAARLAYLHTQDMEEAARSIKRIFEFASTIPNPVPAVDYFDICRTLMYWGNGVSPKSQRIRMRILEDFYSAPRIDTSTKSFIKPTQNTEK